MRTTSTYVLELQLLEQRLRRLEHGFAERRIAWTNQARAVTPEDQRPSLESFVSDAVLSHGGIDADSNGCNLFDEYCYRFMITEEESDIYGQIGIFSAYGIVPSPACFFTFRWHSEMLERPEDLEAIAQDGYFAMRQLAPAVVTAVLEARAESALLRSERSMGRLLAEGSN